MNTDELLVLVPGLACDHHVWQPLLPALAGHARCWVPALPAGPTIDDMAAALLQAAPDARFALAGHSLGGRIALAALRQAPQRVRRLALLDTGWQPRPAGEAGAREQAQREGLVAIAHGQGMRAMGTHWAPGMVAPAPVDGPLYDAVLAMVAAQPAARFAAQQQALLQRPDESALLPTISCPTLVLCGREDGWSPLDRHQELARRIPGAALVVVDDCGHMSTMAQPAAVAAALQAWLAMPAAATP